MSDNVVEIKRRGRKLGQRNRPANPSVPTGADNPGAVMAMVAMGGTPRAIADYLNISTADLRHKYHSELQRGFEITKTKIELSLLNKALHGDVRCMLAWLRQFGGWTEVTRKEITGANGEPISIQSLDTASLDQVLKTLRETAAPERYPGRAISQTVEVGAESIRDLESISGSSDESTEFDC